MAMGDFLLQPWLEIYILYNETVIFFFFVLAECKQFTGFCLSQRLAKYVFRYTRRKLNILDNSFYTNICA